MHEKKGLRAKSSFLTVRQTLIILIVMGVFAAGALWLKLNRLETAGGRPAAVQNEISPSAAASAAGSPSFPAGKTASSVAELAGPLEPQGGVAPVTARDHVKGNRNAKIAVIEYADLECPYCKAFLPVLEEALQNFPDQVFWVYRHYPLMSIHANAEKEAEASECAYDQGGDAAFWKYIDAIYAKTTSNGTGFPLSELTPLAEAQGLSGDTFSSCLTSGTFASYIQNDENTGARIGVNGTPGTVVWNRETGKYKLVAGYVTYDQLSQVITSL
ncbi:DsbA family protein [Patescibacteria group bacterium]|nr:DsbA family protein [Patescibacteria group bacterium]